jgi:hypothetical protein
MKGALKDACLTASPSNLTPIPVGQLVQRALATPYRTAGPTRLIRNSWPRASAGVS